MANVGDTVVVLKDGSFHVGDNIVLTKKQGAEPRYFAKTADGVEHRISRKSFSVTLPHVGDTVWDATCGVEAIITSERKEEGRWIYTVDEDDGRVTKDLHRRDFRRVYDAREVDCDFEPEL